MTEKPSHARVVLTVRTKLSAKAAAVVGEVAGRLAGAPSFREDPEAVVSSEVGAKLIGAPEHVVAAAELAVLVAAADGLNKLDELEQMRLQMAMDQRSKLLESLSNALKKSSEASNAILANLR
jgi:hypothetical protein